MFKRPSILIAVKTKLDVNKLPPAGFGLPDEIIRDIHSHFTAREKFQALCIGIEQGLKGSSGMLPFLVLFFTFKFPFWAVCILWVVLFGAWVTCDAHFHNRGAARLRAFLLSTEHSLAMKYNERFAELNR